ncbi:MAG: SIS domain-containing protein [Clostridia bacterium]|nr:SIS domain-containing protein [Clostridia bacterium]
MKNNEILQKYCTEVSSQLLSTDFNKLAQIVDIIIGTKSKNTIYTAGNGGSATTASHICNDLLKGCAVEGVGFSTRCLCDSLAVLTCLANDFNYNDIFSIQLKSNAKKGDVLIVYSGSGNSQNILNAVNLAKQIGMTVIGFTGRDGGKLKDLCDIIVIAPTYSMEQIEDLHLLYAHAISDCIQKKLGCKLC